MSFCVLVIPEDPTYNGYILKPLAERVLAECGRPNAKATVLTNPKAEGYHHAKALIPSAIERYRHMDLFLFLPDADGKDRGGEFEALEHDALAKGLRLFCCAAIQEVETWLLAGHVEKLPPDWSSIRGNTAVKEEVFNPFLANFGDPKRAGGGRDLLMRETLSNYPGLLSRCPELQNLQDKIRSYLGGR